MAVLTGHQVKDVTSICSQIMDAFWIYCREGEKDGKSNKSMSAYDVAIEWLKFSRILYNEKEE